MGILSRFSQRCTVVTSRSKWAAISFQESRRWVGGGSDNGFPSDGSPIARSELVRIHRDLGNPIIPAGGVAERQRTAFDGKVRKPREFCALLFDPAYQGG